MKSERIQLPVPPLSERYPPVRVIKPGLEGGVDPGIRRLFVVAFDPGVKTGWCVMRVDLESLRCKGLSGVCLAPTDADVLSWSAGYFSGPEPYQAEQMLALLRGTWMHGEGMWNLGDESDYFICAIESFTLREMSTDDSLLASPRVSAMFRALSWRSLFIPVVPQSPADALYTFTDHRLRMFNLWSGEDVSASDGEHQRDATKHAMLTCRKAADPQWMAVMAQRMNWLQKSPG